MNLYFVTIHDEVGALSAVQPLIEALATQGRGRCVPYAGPLELSKFYRLSAIVRGL